MALLAALGAAAGHVYLQLLIRDVDGLDPADGRVAPFLASADSQLSLWTIGCGSSCSHATPHLHPVSSNCGCGPWPRRRAAVPTVLLRRLPTRPQVGLTLASVALSKESVVSASFPTYLPLEDG